ncbi:hypothetical protein [Nodularia spumigena]|uniref:hypothetical protein n=1 Tax=Nodularia spumigena TaxID=70799 RepID=UPI00232FF68A|nr:hypothetical protein [Nodularia spumigena]MDB9319826.1 hypothetical protein [Nodularia spumigena CS-590/01A]MDB9322043.1 hypothetical protein [Nodularia spumigena CS-591/07A]MDB9326779.1 hypothetical protein [Nodularia spumigena CS-590/02]MDB9331068.1 hypothetical protein [Nodularia spumigena CS-591/04]MDB9335457.1 hypothetical protein [Nodularia spumigena CS-590/01]
MIYFQQTNYQIAFLISQESMTLISQWRKGFEYSPSQMEWLMGAADGSPSLPTILRVVDHKKVNLTMEFDFNYTFEAVFDGRESTELVYMKATDYPNDVRKPRDIVLKIEGEPYESLIAWDKWSDAEAFTGKYTYKFKENPTFDMKYIEVTASGGEVICLDDSLSLWND